jgi:hypothetical protein
MLSPDAELVLGFDGWGFGLLGHGGKSIWDVNDPEYCPGQATVETHGQESHS